MRTFKDSTGRAWNVNLTVGDLRRLKNETESHIDLCALLDDDSLAARLKDPAFVGELLYGIVRPQAAGQNIDLEAFCKALGGEHVAAGLDAFAEELASFFGPWFPSLGGLIADALRRRRAAQAQAASEATGGSPTGDESSTPPGPAEATPTPPPTAS